MFKLTILGLAGFVIRLQDVTLHAAASVGSLCICTHLAAASIYVTFIHVCRHRDQILVRD